MEVGREPVERLEVDREPVERLEVEKRRLESEILRGILVANRVQVQSDPRADEIESQEPRGRN